MTERDAEDALPHQVEHGVLDALGVAAIDEARGDALGQAERQVDLAKQQAAAVVGEPAAVEVGGDGAAAMGLELEAPSRA